MANWEKLNKEFDDALDSMTKEHWDNWYKNVEQKRINENKMTAVEWLVEQIIKEKGLVDLDIQAAKEMEKEQIKKSFSDGAQWELYGSDLTYKERAEHYYNQTFKQEEQ